LLDCEAKDVRFLRFTGALIAVTRGGGIDIVVLVFTLLEAVVFAAAECLNVTAISLFSKRGIVI
jgi:hypothetical protein